MCRRNVAFKLLPNNNSPGDDWTVQQQQFSPLIFILPLRRKVQRPGRVNRFLSPPSGRGSDSESDGAPHRKMPDIRKDDMSARRTSVTELRTVLPFNQYLPNKSNQSGYVPTPLRKKKGDREEGGRKSWSTATSPVGGDRPFR